MKNILLVLLVVLSVCCKSSDENSDNKSFENDYTRTIVDSIYDSMNDYERTAQLYGIRSSELIGTDGKLSLELCRKKIPFGVGHISQFACSLPYNPEELKEFVTQLQNYLKTETRSKIPAIFHEEAISGFAAKNATVYPQQIGVSCTWNPELASLKTQETAEAMRLIGGTLALSPMADVVRTPHFNRIEESYGEDAFLSASMTNAFVEGLQKNGLEKGVAACTKHFLGYGDGVKNSDKEIIEEILLPHEVAIRLGGSKVVMTGYHSYKGIQTVANDTLIKSILRDYLGFDGVVISDYGAVNYKCSPNDTALLKERAADAINAGNDIELCNGVSYPFLPELLNEGKVSRERFEEAVKKSLTLKVRLGLFNEDDNKKEKIILDKDNYRETAYKLAVQSIVMLKNNGILPINVNDKKIALVGPNANTFWCMLGDYSYQSMNAFWFGGEVDGLSPKIVSLKEALDRKVKSVADLVYERGCDWNEKGEAYIDRSSPGDPRIERLKMMLMKSSDETNWKNAIEIAGKSDVIIAAVGENPTLCGEGRGRKGIRLPGDQEKFVNELVETGKPVILVIFGGRPQVIGDLSDKCAAILQAWFPGEEGGNAVADILLGKVNPSGKLSVSYPKNEAKGNYCYNYGLNDTLRIAYPFGYGLSYTDYDYSNLSVPKKIKTSDDYIDLQFDLRNSGKYDGEEIVQLYISPKSGQPLKPLQLKGFKRIHLEVGEKRTVKFRLPLEAFAYYKDGKWHLNPGDYECYISSSSEDHRLSSLLTLEGEQVSFRIRNNYFSSCSY